MQFDLVIRNGQIVTAGDEFVGDIGIRDGRIEAIGRNLPPAKDEIEASGNWVMPGGVDTHCHIEEPAYLGVGNVDDFTSASVAAACGGTTTIVPFLNQRDGLALSDAFDAYLAAAQARSVLDFSFHVLLKDATLHTLEKQLPRLFDQGLRSVKVFMTYSGYRMGDAALLDVMSAVADVNGIVMVHAESGNAADWNVARLAAAGDTGLAHFQAAYPPLIEREAVHRAISFAELTGARLMIVHVSSADAMEQIAWARRRDLPILAETCPQYLLGVGDRLHSDEREAAKFICSPPIRSAADSEVLWRGLKNGVIDIVSSDHCPYRFEGPGGKSTDGRPDFRCVPPGLPGLETRLPLLFQGVLRGRISARRFVELTATRPAMIYGLYPRKGAIVPGADADLVIWKAGLPRRLTHSDLHDPNDHSPFEGEEIAAWPVTTLARGERVWDDGKVMAKPGRGRFIKPGQLRP